MYSLLEKLKQKNQKIVQYKPQINLQRTSSKFSLPSTTIQSQNLDGQQQNEVNAENVADGMLDFLDEKDGTMPSQQPASVTKKITKIGQPAQNCEKKKKNKRLLGVREPWTESCKILNIQPPELNQEVKSKKKYKLRLRFQNDKGKVKNYTVRFGDKLGKDYVDHKNIDKRQRFALQVRQCESVLDPNYWRVMLLNNEFPTIQEAWNDFIQSHDYLKMKI